MNLTVKINQTSHRLPIADELIEQAQDFFQKMDADMNRGWQMSRVWVERPDPTQRCQIAADRLLTAVEAGNERQAMMMSAYILWRLPGVEGVDINTTGDITATRFQHPAGHPTMPRPTPPQPPSNAAGVTRADAALRADRDVSPVYKSGRGYRFAQYDHERQQWVESGLTKTREQADELRQEVREQRLQALLAGTAQPLSPT